MNRFTVIPYGRKFAVISPEGDARCVVKSEVFAKTIAKDCSADRRGIENVANHRPKICRSVRCKQTGKVYHSLTAAAADNGISVETVKRDLTHPDVQPLKKRNTFEEAW